MTTKGKPPGRVKRIKAPDVLGQNKELGQAFGEIARAAGITKRKRSSNNPARVPTNEGLRIRRTPKVPSAAALLHDTAPQPLGTGRREPGTPLVDSPSMPTAAELLASTSGEGAEVVRGEKIDRTEYLSPPPSLDPDRPRAREATYNPDTGTLRVVFRNGGSYEYFQVPHQTWRALKNNQSFGQTLDRLVIGSYQFEKVSF